MSGNGARAAGQYFARKRNRSGSAYLVASALFAANPSNGDTLHVNGVAITFGTTVAIGSTTNATLLNVQTYFDNLLNPATDNLIFTVTLGNVLTIYSALVNAPPITVTASAATVTAATTQQATTRARLPL